MKNAFPKSFLFVCTACLIPVAAVAQTTWPDSADPSGIGIGEEFEDSLAALESAGIDVNKAGPAELLDLPGFSPSDATMLIERRSELGGFGSVREAAGTEGLSPTAAEALMKYATVGSTGSGKWEFEAKLASSWHSDCLASGMPIRCFPDTVVSLGAGWLEHWQAAAVIILKPGVSSVRTKDFGDATGLIGTGPTVMVDPAAFHLTYHRAGVSVVAGTFQAGFATGLTLDITGRKHPRGHYPCDSYSVSTDSGSIRKSKRFSGAAATFEIPVASDRFSVTGTVFASYSFMDPSRNDVTYDRCPDGDPGCGDSEKVPFVTFSDPAADGQSTTGLALTNILREGTAGANIGFGTKLWRIEATGWATGLRFRTDAPSIGVATSSPMPEDRRIFGAAGMAGSAVLPGNGLFVAELAVNDRGAMAAVAEAIFSPMPGLDLEPSFRYYSPGWDNPWTGSIADSSEYRGNRARNETAGRLDLTWRSSRFTRNRVRLDAAWHERDDTPGTSPHLDLEAITALEIFASGHERLSLEFGYRDRDVTRSGRTLSWEPYYSESLGNLSGGCRMDWTFSVSTNRIPRTRLTAYVSQAFRDSATLEDRFDIDMAATLRIDSRLSPGPDLSAFLRWSDESMTADRTPSSGQECASHAIGNVLPADCRGDTRLDAGLGLLQAFPMKKGSVRIGLSARYTRHVDDRLSRRSDGETPTGPNEYGATLVLEMDFGSAAARR